MSEETITLSQCKQLIGLTLQSREQAEAVFEELGIVEHLDKYLDAIRPKRSKRAPDSDVNVKVADELADLLTTPKECSLKMLLERAKIYLEVSGCVKDKRFFVPNKDLSAFLINDKTDKDGNTVWHLKSLRAYLKNHYERI